MKRPDSGDPELSRDPSTDGRGEGMTPGRYQPPRRARWTSLGMIALVHAAGFVALRYLEPAAIQPVPTVPLTVSLLPLEPRPSEPKPVALPTRREAAPLPVPQRIAAVTPIARSASPPVPAVAAPPPEPSPPAPARAEEAHPPPPPATAGTMANLDTRLLSAEPPRYPLEARRRHEVGTVVLLVVVDEHGRVASIAVATSSGVDRLDKAALNAVRRWRWSPTLVDGRPSQVKGLVRIPFRLE